MIYSFDIDGTLTSYPKVWLDFISAQTGKTFRSVEDAKANLGATYHCLKHSYRLSDYKYSVPVLDEARSVIEALNDSGHIVFCSTSRPFREYPEMRSRTKKWLQDQGIQVVDVLEKTPENILSARCDFHIDDEVEAINELQAAGIRCFLIDREQSSKDQQMEYTTLCCLHDLLQVPRGTLTAGGGR